MLNITSIITTTLGNTGVEEAFVRIKGFLGQKTTPPMTTGIEEQGPAENPQFTAAPTQAGVNALPGAIPIPQVTRASTRSNPTTEEVNTDGFNAADLRSIKGLGAMHEEANYGHAE